MRRMMCATPPAFRATEMLYSRIFTSALFAGAVAGLIAALLQLVFVQPVLLHAELYESGELVHFGAEAISAHPVLPGLDAMRDGMSVLFTVLVYTGYSMILVALMSLAERYGHEVTAKGGLLWGVAGFIAFHLAPGVSLAPEVPGVAAADAGLRQIWWVGTVLASGTALGLIAFGSSFVSSAAAGILLLAPHLVGAPEPDVLTGPVPPEIAALFAARALGVGMASWVVLGLCAAYFWRADESRARASA